MRVMPLANFSITANADGTGAIVINGENVSERVCSARLDLSARDVPRLTLQTIGEGIINGEGVVQVAAEDNRPIGRLVAEWLSGLDPMQIWTFCQESASLADHPAPLFLRYLAELARQELGE